MERIKELRNKIKECNDEIQSLLPALLKDRANNIFNLYPNIKGFKWRQYTPYFNDGDQCLFNAYTDIHDIFINDIDLSLDIDYYLSYNQNNFNFLDIYYNEENQKSINEFNNKSNFDKSDLIKYKNIIQLIDDYNNIDEYDKELYLKIKQTKEELSKYKYDNDYIQNIFKKVSDKINQIDEESLLFVFGDHAKIKITETEIEIEEYKHD